MTEHFVYSELLIFHDCDSVNKHDNIHILWVESKFKKIFGGVGVLKMVNIQKVAELGKILNIILL